MIAQLLAFLALAAGTWIIRAGFIVSPAGRSLAVRLDPWLTHARPAVLAGLLASLTVRGDSLDEVGALTYIVSVLATITAGAFTQSLAWSLVAGVGALLLLA